MRSWHATFQRSHVQAPAKPKSPVGQMVTYYLKMEPHLFKDALDEQFKRLADEKEEAAKLAKEQKEQQDKEVKDKAQSGSADGEMVLYRCYAVHAAPPVLMQTTNHAKGLLIF